MPGILTLNSALEFQTIDSRGAHMWRDRSPRSRPRCQYDYYNYLFEHILVSIWLLIGFKVRNLYIDFKSVKRIEIWRIAAI
jgi:hypothetical protein